MTLSGIVLVFQQRQILMQMPAIRLFSLLALCISAVAVAGLVFVAVPVLALIMAGALTASGDQI